MKNTENHGLRAEARNVLDRHTRIMMDKALPDYSWDMSDMDKVTRALDALSSIREPKTNVQRIMNERAMAEIENGLFWSVAMLERNGFQEAKGLAWHEADQEQAKAVLDQYQRLTAHQRN